MRLFLPLRSSLCLVGVASCLAVASLTPVSRAQAPPETAQPIAQQLRAAEAAYLAGARKLEKRDLSGAEADFTRAAALSPANRDYALALALAREHRVSALVQQASQARLGGDAQRAESMLAEARAIDPENAILLEHSGLSAGLNQPAARRVEFQTAQTLTNRNRLLAGDTVDLASLRTDTSNLAGPTLLTPKDGISSFHLSGDSQTIVQQVAGTFGIKTIFEGDIDRRPLTFDVDNVRYDQAMGILMSMAETFATPVDANEVIVAKDDAENRRKLTRMVQETISLPGMSVEDITFLANMLRNVFEVKQTTVQTGRGNIVVRVPAESVAPMNRTLADLVDGGGEVMLEIKLYAIDKTRMRNIGATIPTQFGAFNVDQAATQLVNANQTLVQQAIAQGLVPAGTSNLVIALALIQSGLVQSNLLSTLIGVVGGGFLQTGLTASSGVTFNAGLNTSEARALDDVQVRVRDGETAVFRAGTKYPITTSTFSTGITSATSSALAGATVNGVSVASLLSQYAGSSATIPQISYEDLGVTLKATPVMQKSGRIYMKIDLKIEALAGGTENGIPILANRQITSNITVADGESALMASNLSKTESGAVTGIPGLSELPGFQGPLDKDAEKDTSELVMVVTPHVVRRRSNLVAGPQMVVQALEPQG